MTHDHPVIAPAERVCCCPERAPDGPHTPECEQQHRDTFMAAWRDARARFYGANPYGRREDRPSHY